MDIVLDNGTIFTTSASQDKDLIDRLNRNRYIDFDIEPVVNTMFKNRYMHHVKRDALLEEKFGLSLTYKDINIIWSWINGLYSEDQKKIEYLKHELCGYGTISDEEQEEAKSMLGNKISKDASLLEKLKIMIKIKEQIVQRHTKRFYIDDDLFLLNDFITDKEVFANFDNGVIYLSGGISTVLIHDDVEFMEDALYYQQPRDKSDMLGFWSLSKNLTSLRFNYYSDKRTKDDKCFYATN